MQDSWSNRMKEINIMKYLYKISAWVRHTSTWRGRLMDNKVLRIEQDIRYSDFGTHHMLNLVNFYWWCNDISLYLMMTHPKRYFRRGIKIKRLSQFWTLFIILFLFKTRSEIRFCLRLQVELTRPNGEVSPEVEHRIQSPKCCVLSHAFHNL
jgi:hypothetical protein